MFYTEGDPVADTKAPEGAIETQWERRRFGAKLVTRPTSASSP